MSKIKNKKLIFGFLIGITVAVVATLLALINPFESWHLKLSNSLFTLNEPSTDIVIAAIDEKSITESKGSLELEASLGRFQNWDRDYYTDVIKNISNSGAKVIGVDLYFSEYSNGISKRKLEEIFLHTESEIMNEVKKYSPLLTLSPIDQSLAKVLQDHLNKVVLAGLIKGSKENFDINNALLPVPEFTDSNLSNVGFVNWSLDSDKTLRTMPLEFTASNQQTYKSFSFKIAEIFTGGIDVSKIPLEDGKMLINYFGRPNSIKRVSFSDIYFDNYEPDDFKDKIVLIGVTTTKAAQDEYLTPTGRTFMPGVEVHAHAVQTILEGKFLRNVSGLEQVGIIAIIAFFGALALVYLNIWFGIVFALVLIFAYTGTAHAAYYNGVIFNMVYPYFAILFTYFGSIIYKYFAELREKSYIENAFGRYLSPNVMHAVIDNPETLHLGGTKKEVTVFFSDIENFATVSEELTPEDLISQLNEYLSVMTDIIMKNEGTLDKYVGDAIVAYFGAPVQQEDHAKKACIAALQMRAALANLHDKWQKEGKKQLEFRAGINTGEVIVGNIGSEKRFDYTIMGDNVNLGSRLEGANKKYGTHIMISEATLAKIGGAGFVTGRPGAGNEEFVTGRPGAGNSEFITRQLDVIRVKGRARPVRVYELLARKGALSQVGAQLVEAYNSAMLLYEKRDFQAAHEAFKRVLSIYPGDGPSQLYLQRAEILRDFPPAENWDGVFTMKDK